MRKCTESDEAMMDAISRELHLFLVKMGYEGVAHEREHQMEHLVALLEPEAEEALSHYYGLFGCERLSLNEIAEKQGLQPELALKGIEKSLRLLAVTPEWQMMNVSLRPEI